ncbi:MAG TPA: PHP domain-containing protein [Acidimicrobiales bacterium]|nr:PHP domain-containing protein [Acidimicrobiales bacterium]
MTDVADARHPDLARPAAPGRIRVDCHVHTMWSGDATTTPDELARAVVETGIDVLAITDHQTVAGALALAERLPCRVVVGQECRTPVGEVIGLFLSERVTPGLSATQVVQAIRDQGGLVYVPHPFDELRHRLRDDVLVGLAADGGLDALEVRNAKTSLEHPNHRAAEFAQAWNLAPGAGSDAHVPAALGSAWVEVEDFADATSFLAALHSPTARIVGHHADPPRPWTPRVVPSTREP